MGWDAKEVALLQQLWTMGQSAEQIARRLDYSRNAVCAKLTRLGLKRGRKPPTAKPRIVSVPKRRTTSLAACTRPAAKVTSSRKPVVPPQREPSKRQLYAMLA